MWNGANDPQEYGEDHNEPVDGVLTDDDLDAIEARVAAATPAPWLGGEDGDIGALMDTPDSFIVATTAFFQKPTTDQERADALFIAHARRDVPALIAEVRRLRAGTEVDAFTIGRLKSESIYEDD